ncbi:hypothetical protein Mgra_00008663 [Meloidogyne graminicola]|uniref:Uncharacterized protein n=1 Tax=Meloidogyne graminicola TaxID=189291 RepID=A0A8S9ZF38_9BILA|nr:hypothetical protein Mgra_00008663 [Meloidogyne graminicola]
MALGPKVMVIINTFYVPTYGKVSEDRCEIEIHDGCTINDLINMTRFKIANDNGTVWDDNPQFRVYFNGQEQSLNNRVFENRMYVMDVFENKEY